MPEEHHILALNCGSSSLKFGVFSNDNLLIDGEAEELGGGQSRFWSRDQNGVKKEATQPVPDHKAAFAMVRKILGDIKLSAAGHRVVHGGPALREHFRLSDDALDKLKTAVPFAPLHLPASLAVIEAVSESMGNLPQVVCLDTAFHRHLPDVAKTLPFSPKVREQGVERYGFHGLSLESIVAQLNEIPARTVVAHLGNGSSVTAVQDGKSVDTSMGLTPSGGVMMGTRCGDVDPGALLYLLKQGWNAGELETLVDHQSGLLGVSGRSSDVRELTKARDADSKSDLALRMFAYQVKKAIASMAAALGGLDLLVVTGGIGEHSKAVLSDIVTGLSFLGKFELKTLPSQEDLQIARITSRVTKAAS